MRELETLRKFVVDTTQSGSTRNWRSSIEKSIACRSTFRPVRQKGRIGRVVGNHILVHANLAWMGCEVFRCARCLSISNFLHGRKTWTTLSSHKRLCVLHGRDVRAPPNEHLRLRRSRHESLRAPITGFGNIRFSNRYYRRPSASQVNNKYVQMNVQA